MSSDLRQKMDELNNLIKTYQASNDIEYIKRFLQQVEEKQKEIKELEK